MLYTIAPRPSPNRSPRIPGDPIDLICLHATVGSFSSALSWLRNPSSGVSTHYLISKQGDIANLVDETEQAWHAGVSFWRGRTDINRYSIGIELENANDGKDPYPEAQRDALAWLVNIICFRRCIPKDRQHIVTHYEIAPRRKSDPAGFSMPDLMRRIGSNEAVLQPDVYYVVPSRVNVRQGPGTMFDVAAQLQRGDAVNVDTIIGGEPLFGTAWWAHLADGRGFVKVELLRHGN